jgi:hypothetical protein
MQRKYPRVACNHVAELELRRPDGVETNIHIAIAARIHSLSAGGLGLRVEAPWGLLLRRGDWVVSRFALDGTSMEVPGHIAWCASGRVGVRLELELASPADREAFADSLGVEIPGLPVGEQQQGGQADHG